MMWSPASAPEKKRCAPRESFPCACGDQGAFLLGERRIEMQHERIDVRAELGDDKRHLLRHQRGDERNIARQTIEFGDDDLAFETPRLRFASTRARA